MCTNPIRIRNPALFIDPQCSALFITVPCGKCLECVDRLRMDMTLRHYYEFKDSKYFCYFDTLTYNDEHLPHFGQLPCFDRKHITDFIKRLRMALSRQGYTLSNGSKNLLKFSLTSEYGHLKGRPHYHILWFSSVEGLTPFALWNLTRKLWYYGFNDKFSDVQNHIVTNINALQYVAKYVGKDQYFEKTFEKFLGSGIRLEELEEAIQDYRSLRPFRRSSLDFGYSIANIDPDVLFRFGVPYYTSRGLQYGRIPEYVKRKLFYDKLSVGEHTIYKLNQLGIDYKFAHLDEELYKFADKVNNYLINSPYELQKDFYSTLEGRTIRDYCIYRRVYQGHLIPSGLTPFWNLPDYKLFYRDQLTTFERGCLVDNPNLYALGSKEYERYERNIFTEDSHYSFRGFDRLDNIVSQMMQNECHDRYLVNQYNNDSSNKTYEICQRFGFIS